MSWLTYKEAINAICITSIFFLLGGGSLIGLGSVTDNIAHSGITLAHFIAGGLAYILYAFWKGYI